MCGDARFQIQNFGPLDYFEKVDHNAGFWTPIETMTYNPGDNYVTVTLPGGRTVIANMVISLQSPEYDYTKFNQKNIVMLFAFTDFELPNQPRGYYVDEFSYEYLRQYH